MTSDTPFVAPKIVRRGEGQCLELRGEVRHQILGGTDTNGALALAHSQFRRGAGSPLHVHTREDEWFWIESGTFRFQIGDQIHQIGAGTFLFGPRFIPHSYVCQSEEGGVLWVGVVGAGFENFFGELAEQNGHGMPPSRSMMREIASTYGVQLDHWDEMATPSLSPQVVLPYEGECLEAFGDCGRVLLASEATDNRFCVAIGETPSFLGPPLHVHEREDEVFIIRRGCYEFHIGDARIQVGPGDVVFAPRGVPHCFRVLSNEPGQALMIATPGGFDRFFRQAAILFERAEVTPEAMMALSQQHGIHFLNPEC